MDTYYSHVVAAARHSRNHMIAAASTAVLLGVAIYFTQSLWLALPVLGTAVWYRTYEDSYKHYSSLKKGLEYDGHPPKEVERR